MTNHDGVATEPTTSEAVVPPVDSRPPGHASRESIETIIFVVILVLLLRSFGAEAFAIPTGSMAPTLLGAHKDVVCPSCGYAGPINATSESEGDQHGGADPLIEKVDSAICPNCRLVLDVEKLGWSGGDRVLVAKSLHAGIMPPKRWDVVVFKCPEFGAAQVNYIKRLIGLPGETIKIEDGDIWVGRGDGAYAIARKPVRAMMAESRLVFDNNYLPSDIKRRELASRWTPDSPKNWTIADDGRTFTCSRDAMAWLTYRHRVGLARRDDRDEVFPPQLITDFESYNSDNYPKPGRSCLDGACWVGDLMLAMRVEAAKSVGEVAIELGEGTRRYRCALNLGTRRVALAQNGVELAATEYASLPSGPFDLRFANVDDRLTVWVDDRLVFGEGIDVAPPRPEERGPRPEDLAPVRVGVAGGGASLSRLSLWRDTFYRKSARDAEMATDYPNLAPVKSLATWRERHWLGLKATFTLEPDEFFCLGDNSPCSFDGREWRRTQFVSRHQMLGRALLLYWPISRWKFVR